ncbi:MAG: hypothetical protein IT327_23590 [Anaerolineae bacterium]|nr:hypothetical protein [Anaerolineae bacterium]
MKNSNPLYLPPFLGDLFFGALFTYGVEVFRTQSGMAPLTASAALVLWLLSTILFNFAGLLLVALIDRILTNESATAADKALVAVMPLPEINHEIPDEEDVDPFWPTSEAGYE